MARPVAHSDWPPQNGVNHTQRPLEHICPSYCSGDPAIGINQFVLHGDVSPHDV